MLMLEIDLFKRLEKCKHEPVPEGYEKLFLNNVTKNGNEFFLYGVKLKKLIGRSNNRGAFSFTTYNRHRIINSLIQHLEIRIGWDATLIHKLQPMTKLISSATIQELKVCHSCIVPDLNYTLFISD